MQKSELGQNPEFSAYLMAHGCLMAIEQFSGSVKANNPNVSSIRNSLNSLIERLSRNPFVVSVTDKPAMLVIMKAIMDITCKAKPDNLSIISLYLENLAKGNVKDVSDEFFEIISNVPENVELSVIESNSWSTDISAIPEREWVQLYLELGEEKEPLYAIATLQDGKFYGAESAHNIFDYYNKWNIKAWHKSNFVPFKPTKNHE